MLLIIHNALNNNHTLYLQNTHKRKHTKSVAYYSLKKDLIKIPSNQYNQQYELVSSSTNRKPQYSY